MSDSTWMQQPHQGRFSGNSTLLPSASEKYMEETIKVQTIPPLRANGARSGRDHCCVSFTSGAAATPAAQNLRGLKDYDLYSASSRTEAIWISSSDAGFSMRLELQC